MTTPVTVREEPAPYPTEGLLREGGDKVMRPQSGDLP